jgi:WD40 repeat protein
VFNACWKKGNAEPFRKNPLANKTMIFPGHDFPSTEINVSPHSKDYATNLIDSITDHIKDKETKSVLFSVMDMGKASTGTLIPSLRDLHKDDSIFTYGITDNSGGEISLYKPGEKDGLLIDAKKANRELPPPFKKEFNLGLAHAIHHKFIVTNFNKDSGRVYCGSSNLALGGEVNNGDNLLCIKDVDVATVFAIEAFRLTDHYNFRSVKDKVKRAGVKPKPARLDDTGKWVDKFYDQNDIRYVERDILA